MKRYHSNIETRGYFLKALVSLRKRLDRDKKMHEQQSPLSFQKYKLREEDMEMLIKEPIPTIADVENSHIYIHWRLGIECLPNCLDHFFVLLHARNRAWARKNRIDRGLSPELKPFPAFIVSSFARRKVHKVLKVNSQPTTF